MVNMKKILSLVLSLCMLLGMANIAFAEAAADQPADEPREANTLIIGYTEFNEKFSPFYGETGYDIDVFEFVLGTITTLDRQGNMVMNGIKGETLPYGDKEYTYTGMADLSVDYDSATDKTTYTVKLREDIVFSDGTPMTADDLIFTYYVLLDPSYIGATTLNSYPIVGLKAYQTQTPEAVYNKYDDMVKAIYSAGSDHEWAEGDAWTKDQQDAFWALLKAAWTEDVQDIVNFVVANYNTDDYAPTVGATPAEISANEGLQIAFGMAMWGFAEQQKPEEPEAPEATEAAEGEENAEAAETPEEVAAEPAPFILVSGDKSWNLTEGEYPTIDDYYTATYNAYGGNPEAFFGTEAVDSEAKSTLDAAQQAFIQEQGQKEPEAQAGVPSIEGIKKVDDYTVTVTTNGFSAPAIYQMFGGSIAPLHYYGDRALYDYDNNKFGFPFGDLTMVEAKTTQPMGAGPYKFVKYENKVVYLEANELYFKGAPKIKNIMLKETLEPDKVPGVLTGTLDIAEPSFSNENIKTIKDANGGELRGDVIYTSTVDYPGYGYIGVNANNVSVGGEAASEASRNLRRAILTALALYRDVVVDSYYGERASVINYPISNTSWAAPQKTDADYKVAFSVDATGADIYTADMTMEQKEEAALKAIQGFFAAAGYTLDDSGKITAAPEGGLMEVECLIGGGGTGDHPSFGILTDGKALLEKVGFTLTINDMSDWSALQDKVKSGNGQLWCMAWQATNTDPDMYQIYHSSNVLGAGGTDSNHYMLADAELDQLILDGRTSPDQSYRKAVYKAALDKIIDWAVELPVYQRQECMVYSAERLNLDTLTQDVATFYKYFKEIELLEMK